MRCHHPVIIVVLLALPAIAIADDWPIPRGPSYEPAPYRYDPDHLKKAPKKFLDDASAVLVYYGITHDVEPDGTVVTTTHEVTRLNGRKGIANLGEYRGITFDPAYQKITLNEARVIKPDGKIVPIRPAHVKLRDAGTNYEVYDQEKEVVISFPSLHVGDVYEVKWTTRGKHPEDMGHFFTRYQFGTVQYPIVRDELRVQLPKDKPLKFQAINGQVKPATVVTGKRRLYTFRLNNHPALPKDYDLPSREELRWQLLCSTFPSWEAVGAWKKKVRKDCWECTPKIRELARRLTKDIATPVDKARVLTLWVRRNIRYVSVVSARHRYRPRTPAKVLTNMYGDCKDSAQLLAVMLREVGIDDVCLVTLGIRNDGQVVQDVPCPWGTHAILLVKLNGKEHWLDTTSTLTSWDFLPRYARDRLTYISNKAGEIQIRRTPALHWLHNRVEQTTLVTVQPDGTSHHSRLARYRGLAAVAKRGDWLDEPRGEQRRKMTAVLLDNNNRSKLLRLDLEKTNLHDLDNAVTALIQFEIPKHFRGDEALEANFIDGRAWSHLLAYNVAHDRRPALDLGTPSESMHRYIVKLPPAYRLVTSSWQEKYSSKWGFFAVEVKRKDDDTRRVEIKMHLRITETRVPPKDFAAYRAWHEDVYGNWRVWLKIKPTAKLEDVPLLEAAVNDEPKDMVTTRILAKLLLKHGDRDKAKLVLEKALTVADDNRDMWELLTQACHSLREQEHVYRRLAKRFPDDMEPRLELGRICVALANYKKGEQILTELTKAKSASLRGQAFYHLARSALAQQRAGKALYHLYEARRADKKSLDSVETLSFLGEVYAKRREWREAAIVYRKVCRMQPKNAGTLAKLIRIEQNAKESRHALQHLREFTVLVNGKLEGLVQAALLHLHLGRLDDALDLALRARDIDFHADAQKVLGLVYVRQTKYDKAVFHLERAHRDDDVTRGLLRAHLALGALTKATKLSAKADGDAFADVIRKLQQRKGALLAIMTFPANKAAEYEQALDYFVCAEYQHGLGRPAEEVKTLLDKALRTKLPLGPAYALRGLLTLNRGRLRAAFADVETAVRYGPEEALVLYVRGRIYFERCDNRALADLQRAADLSKRKDAAILHALAAALWEAGQHKQAKATQQEAMRLRPDDAEIQRQWQRFNTSAK